MSNLQENTRKFESEDDHVKTEPASKKKHPFSESALGKKRQDFLNWEDFFMGVAVLASQRSKDPKTQVGACIVNQDNVIVGIGYNGFPRGCSDDDFPWVKNAELNNKHLYVCHAELNAILNKNSEKLKGCTIYVTLFPCNKCAQCIIQSGISKVIYLRQKKEDIEIKASKIMLDEVGISYSQYKPNNLKTQIIIDLA